MVKVENYPNAYKEVYEILKYVSQENLEKIPKNFIEMIEKYMNKEYKFSIISQLDLFEGQELMIETQMILAYIFINYWATEEQRKIINEKLRKDIEESENQKRKLYNVDVFKEIRQFGEKIEERSEIVIYKKESIIGKVLNKIKNFLTKILK